MQDIAIEINGLSKRYGNVRAVDNLNLRVQKGEMFGLVGPDGAGKTTTLRMLCGIIEPDSGNAAILGFDLRHNIDRIKKRIGYLSQRFSLYGDLTVDENIGFFAEIHGVTDYRNRCEELLQFTRLTPFRNRLADKLSGGMKQKLALACTLIHTPEIIFLDEPTVGVDPVSRRDFWLILSKVLKRGITVILTTPYLDEAERCARVALMNEGRIMVCDTPRNVRSMMKGSVIEVVCDEIRKAYAILKDTPDISEVQAQAFGDRLNIVVTDGERYSELIKQRLQDKNIDVKGLRVVAPSLENVFISMVRAS